jgi:hypothetical protein
MIVDALEPALVVGREHDPYFTHLFPDVGDEMDLPDGTALEGIPSREERTDE